MIVVDTTILVYALGVDHPLCRPSRALLQLVGEGAVRATTTVEVVREFAHVRSRRRPRAETSKLAGEYATGLAPLVRPDEDDLSLGLELFQASDDLVPFDAVLAAVALRRRWALASATGSFAQVNGLEYLDPGAAGFLEGARAAG